MNNPTVYILGSALFQSFILPLVTYQEAETESENKTSSIKKTVEKLRGLEWKFKPAHNDHLDVYDFAGEGEKTILATTLVAENRLVFMVSGNVFRVKVLLKNSIQKTYNLGIRLPDVETLAYEVDTSIEMQQAEKKWTPLENLGDQGKKLYQSCDRQEILDRLQCISSSVIELNQKLFADVQTTVMKNISFLTSKMTQSDLKGTWHCTSSGLLKNKESADYREVGSYHSFTVLEVNRYHLMSFAVPADAALSPMDKVIFTRVLKITMEKRDSLIHKQIKPYVFNK